MKTLQVNLFAGPGSGKSTLCAGLFTLLKLQGVSCEMAREWVKEEVWAGRALPNQMTCWGHQCRREDDLMGEVDVIVTDSPPALSLVYGEDLSLGEVGAMWNRFYRNPNVLNVFVERVKPYEVKGRLHNRDAALKLDDRIYAEFAPYDLTVIGDASGLFRLHSAVTAHLGGPV